MYLKIEYSGFRLRDDTDHLVATENVIRFFDDFKIKYSIEIHKSMNGGMQEKVIWSSYDNEIDIPLNTFDDLRELCKKYDAKIIVENDFKIRFNQPY